MKNRLLGVRSTAYSRFGLNETHRNQERGKTYLRKSKETPYGTFSSKMLDVYILLFSATRALHVTYKSRHRTHSALALTPNLRTVWLTRRGAADVSAISRKQQAQYLEIPED